MACFLGGGRTPENPEEKPHELGANMNNNPTQTVIQIQDYLNRNANLFFI